jgi:hypothetical protein
MPTKIKRQFKVKLIFNKMLEEIEESRKNAKSNRMLI